MSEELGPQRSDTNNSSELELLRRENHLLKQLLTADLRYIVEDEKVGRVFHDFNNILSSSMGYSNLALERSRSSGDEKLIRYLDNIERAGIRARDLVKDSLESRRARRDAHQTQLRAVCIEVFGEVAASLDPGHRAYCDARHFSLALKLLNGLYSGDVESIWVEQSELYNCEECNAEFRGLQTRLNVVFGEGSLLSNEVDLTLAKALINGTGGHLCGPLVQERQFDVYLRAVVPQNSH